LAEESPSTTVLIGQSHGELGMAPPVYDLDGEWSHRRERRYCTPRNQSAELMRAHRTSMKSKA